MSADDQRDEIAAIRSALEALLDALKNEPTYGNRGYWFRDELAPAVRWAIRKLEPSRR